jgi:AAA domain/UvrD-like helicase C-terminal domain
MAELAVSKEFLASYAKLEPPLRRAVDAAIGKFAEHTHAGLHLEKLHNARDPRIRTIRINLSHRGVVIALGGQDYVLHNVLPHDDAIAYATSHMVTVNQRIGVLEVHDEQRLDSLLQQPVPASGAGLFDRVSNSDLRRLGIDTRLLPCIRAFTTDEQFEALEGVLPDTQFQVLTGLAAGMSVQEVWVELAERMVSNVDADDLLTAARRTPERISFVSGPHELASILAHPFDVWRTFLHPTQRDVALRDVYTGPALVTGSAGTGKTVTGLHRAVFLAKRLPADGSKVLVTTFTRALADSLKGQLGLLTDDRVVRDRIDVIGVDRLAHQIVSSGSGGTKRVNIIDDSVLQQLWAEAAVQVSGLSGAFLRREWEQVILAQGLTTFEAYSQATRRGSGVTLRPEQRKQVWLAVSHVLAALSQRRQRTHLQLAEEAAAIVQQGGLFRYRSIVVDEGQDLHPAQWRLLRALVQPGGNDMFILADPHQRIYDSQVSLARLGIEVRGRSRRLTVNYRTTHEILDWSVKVLTGQAATGLDDEADSLAGYRSTTRGQPPALKAHRDRDSEFESLIQCVGTWLDQGVEPHAIGVATRTNQLARLVTDVLREALIPVAELGSAGVHISSMHGMKGLEFQCLAVVGLDAGTLPAAGAVTDEAEDAVAHRQDLMRERCLLFVAATRARDVLYLSHSGAPSRLLPQQTQQTQQTS